MRTTAKALIAMTALLGACTPSETPQTVVTWEVIETNDTSSVQRFVVKGNTDISYLTYNAFAEPLRAVTDGDSVWSIQPGQYAISSSRFGSNADSVVIDILTEPIVSERLFPGDMQTVYTDGSPHPIEYKLLPMPALKPVEQTDDATASEGDEGFMAGTGETLSYDVEYKWGVLYKHGGSVTLSLSDKGDRYDAMLTATTDPWADAVYRLRDTLMCQMRKPDLRPFFYEKISHEGDYDKHDRVNYSYKANGVSALCTRFVQHKGRITKNETRTLTSEGETVDMLTAFYYMRRLPYQEWKPGHQHRLTIFSGKRKETLTIDYHGVERIKHGDGERDCYSITFIFTQEGNTKTSDDTFAWISTDDKRLPIMLKGELTVGSIQCILKQ